METYSLTKKDKDEIIALALDFWDHFASTIPDTDIYRKGLKHDPSPLNKAGIVFGYRRNAIHNTFNRNEITDRSLNHFLTRLKDVSRDNDYRIINLTKRLLDLRKTLKPRGDKTETLSRNQEDKPIFYSTLTDYTWYPWINLPKP